MFYTYVFDGHLCVRNVCDEFISIRTNVRVPVHIRVYAIVRSALRATVRTAIHDSSIPYLLKVSIMTKKKNLFRKF